MRKSIWAFLIPLALPLACRSQTAAVETGACVGQTLAVDPAARWATPWPHCDDGTGSGNFGTWTVDQRSLPAYRYTMRQETDPLARYKISTQDDRRLHWSGFGNDRVTALFYNVGTVELLAQERGILSLNNVVPPAGHWGGGIGVILENGKAWSTLAWNNSHITDRLFTMDGGQVIAQKDDLEVTHRTWAPVGDLAALRVEARFVNRSHAKKEFTYLETWDVTPEQRFFGLVSAGLTKQRAEFNRNFDVQTGWSKSSGSVTASFPNHLPQPAAPDEKSFVYPTVFLTDPRHEATDGYASQKVLSFDKNGRLSLDLTASPQISLTSAEGAPLRLTLRWSILLAPGETKDVQGVFGYAYPDMPQQDAVVAEAARSSWRSNGVRQAEQSIFAATPEAPWLTRETAWHTAMLNANSMYDSYHGAHVFNQGSTYGYLQGINGAPRDQVLALLPTIYFRPDLAKENLRYIMRTTGPSGRIYYAALGVGVLTGAGLHENPSDLDIFFLWGISEYLLLTRDYDFLDEKVAYYETGVTGQTTVRDHIRKAYQHLTEGIGFGSHGLFRLRDGDWSDGILLRAANAEAARARGESTFDSAMAAYVLPRLAGALAKADPTLAAAAKALGDQQAAAFEATWQSDWYLRGYGDVDEPIGTKELFLEPHVFALLANIVPPDRKAKLFAAIADKLERRSPIGQWVVYPPYQGNTLLEPGWDVNGGTWHAINGLLTAGYAASNGKRAWDSLVRNSMMNHAEQYPDIWYGIWSGPDSFNAAYAKRPGETFQHFATPMIDFPVMNSNQHALPLYATLRGYGLEATTGGMAVRPAFTEKPFVLRTPWVKVAGGPDSITVEVKALFAGERWVSVRKPPGAAGECTASPGTVIRKTKYDCHVLWNPAVGELLTVTLK